MLALTPYMQPPNMGMAYMQPPNMGMGGAFAFQPNIGIEGMDSTHFQGYNNPFWKLGYNFPSMPASSSVRGLGPVQNYTGEFMQGYTPWHPGAPPGAPPGASHD